MNDIHWSKINIELQTALVFLVFGFVSRRRGAFRTLSTTKMAHFVKIVKGFELLVKLLMSHLYVCQGYEDATDVRSRPPKMY